MMTNSTSTSSSAIRGPCYVKKDDWLIYIIHYSTCIPSSLSAPPSTPTVTSLTSTYSDQLTVTWTSVPTATSYSVSINSSSSTSVTITSSGSLQITFIGLTSDTVYTVSVVAINSAGSSSAVTVNNQTGK